MLAIAPSRGAPADDAAAGRLDLGAREATSISRPAPRQSEVGVAIARPVGRVGAASPNGQRRPADRQLDAGIAALAQGLRPVEGIVGLDEIGVGLGDLGLG
jgi:hypothetical protein